MEKEKKQSIVKNPEIEDDSLFTELFTSCVKGAVKKTEKPQQSITIYNFGNVTINNTVQPQESQDDSRPGNVTINTVHAQGSEDSSPGPRNDNLICDTVVRRN
ncbi:hypothetical protein ACFFRR_010624 [Megaselia abdita]